ncbi:RluA family pseudouridine synthase [Mycoplasmopsis agassizii]|uniref:Pseudouridine synthase n=1 Tax=Mycoplasmopsis agassizii TaxID=33922 RepID=A0ABX4H6L9_9BACT|nr:RluA family pseudouridine synthase [Mycoplasmopsis agassizii]PAF55548.1 pseudouridine synthase [Mycoplasmopsis agassizii]SMC17879.1 23S rRNA pseudouridine1911/1915/1917 synthase [Mycoplasmopsis agassizii]
MLKLTASYRERIDKYIAANSNISRNDIQKLIEQGAVTVDQMQVRKSNFLLKEGAQINVTKLLEKIVDIKAEEMALKIVYEDEFLMVIDKPSGLVVHPAPGNMSGTLVNGLVAYAQNLSNENGLLRPGIVHRLDKNTSGLLIVAKTNEAHVALANMLAKREIKRRYYAIVSGLINNQVINIDAPIGRDSKDRKKMQITNINSKSAQTEVHLVEKFAHNKKMYSLVRCHLKTGRTHQIRIHLAYIKHPVLNDEVYGGEIVNPSFGQYLHAYELEFKHPFKEQNLKFNSQLPKEFDEFLKKS